MDFLLSVRGLEFKLFKIIFFFSLFLDFCIFLFIKIELLVILFLIMYFYFFLDDMWDLNEFFGVRIFLCFWVEGFKMFKGLVREDGRWGWEWFRRNIFKLRMKVVALSWFFVVMLIRFFYFRYEL